MNLRQDLMELDGAIRAIMTTRTMTEDDRTVLQYALDSIDYILKSQNWLDDEWVFVGFQNIEKARALLEQMGNDDDTYEQCLRRARSKLSKMTIRQDRGESSFPPEVKEAVGQLRKKQSSLIKADGIIGGKSGGRFERRTIGTLGTPRTPQQKEEDEKRRKEEARRREMMHPRSNGHGHGR